MGLAEDHLGPRWLHSYGDIQADIGAMEEFAADLAAEVRDNYAPHMSAVYEHMATEIPQPAALFAELVSFLTVHQLSQQSTSDLVYHYHNVTGGLATSAAEISRKYADTDAFSAATVTDVNQALDRTAAAAPDAATTDQAH
ncbi:hypothetical protein AB0M79_13135 [Polymorphospora sp. NPDC051019]|uniref:hypothetical protein n=1 Tax=Polymorphospora sp. NPDC051019 TaxID=3155725 RepID=UPI0034251677